MSVCMWLSIRVKGLATRKYERLMKTNKRLMFVYGTLKKGERLHGLLYKQKRIGTATTVDSNFTIKDFLNSYPITFRHFDKGYGIERRI